MKQVELNMEIECRLMARRAGWVALKLEKNGHKGVPDDLFISPTGRVVFIEFKKDEKQTPRPEQIHWMERYPDLIRLVGSVEKFRQIIAENGTE